MSMGRKRKPGPKRRSRKTGGIVKGSTHVMEHKREAIVQPRDMGHSGNKISSVLAIPKSAVNRIIREITDNFGSSSPLERSVDKFDTMKNSYRICI